MRGKLGVEGADHGRDGLGLRGECEVAAAEEQQSQGQVEGDVRAISHGRVLRAHAASQVPDHAGIIEFL